ncbi:YbaN family protein [Acinetobacter baumannii]|jgi:hypothetical protein|uniref:Inner membrane protein n=14 Tax=Pseudomonadota TaxID=1224 RepID=A0A9P2REF5_ACIBA|nr:MULTISPECIES: YbaN family protein [Moraxellaceae]AWT50300.1 DUF454 domain-containing protein [Psychrobacter sp. YP14]AYX98598.1 DUF454 domain-containing protein [Acinetobacter sp. FDAARGOS_493]EGJ69642.1 hypothetical protein HMPREF0022_00584 [Acinetobacter baumannii 6014059]EHU1230741.1 YbaN family protein [Acinetobacter baumannii]EHU1234708.1 YbaN family protein [Acinetobacter baumannii]
MDNIYPSPQQKTLQKEIAHSQMHHNRFVRLIFMILGAVFFILGLIGIVLPVLPTTPFILLTATCWAKGSIKFNNWLLNHKIFGKMVIDWQQHRAIPRKAKYLAWSMMALSCGMLFYRFSDNWQWLAWATCVICITVAIWMSRLPDA